MDLKHTDLKQINLGVNKRHTSVVKSTMGLISGFKYESDNLIDFSLNGYIMSNRAIEVKLPGDNNKEVKFLYTRGTVMIPNGFKEFRNFNYNYIYKNSKKIVINLDTKEVVRLTKLDGTSSIKNKWLKIIKGLDKAYAICFQDEKQVDNEIDQFIYEYFSICKDRFKKEYTKSQKLKSMYIKLFKDKYEYSEFNILDLCRKKEEEKFDKDYYDDNFVSVRISDNQYKINKVIKIHTMNSATLLCLSNILKTSLELGKGITFKDKKTGDYYSIWVIGKTYNSENIDKIAKNKKLMCICNTEAINMLTKRELNNGEVSIKLKSINMLNPNIIILKHNKNKTENSILDIEDYEFYNELQKVPKEYYDPIMIILGRIGNKHNRLNEKELFKERIIYNFGFDNILESIHTYNNEDNSNIKWDIKTDSAKVLAVLLDE